MENFLLVFNTSQFSKHCRRNKLILISIIFVDTEIKYKWSIMPHEICVRGKSFFYSKSNGSVDCFGASPMTIFVTEAIALRRRDIVCRERNDHTRVACYKPCLNEFFPFLRNCSPIPLRFWKRRNLRQIDS